MKTALKSLSALAICAGSANAAVVVGSSSFNGISDRAIVTTGLNDWGYIKTDNTFFGSNSVLDYTDTNWDALTNAPSTAIISTSSGSSTIGDVTVTEIGGTNQIGKKGTAFIGFSFDGTEAQGSYGDFGGTEDDVWSMTLNNLGVGTHTIALYMGHTALNRKFSMDIDGTGLTASTTTMANTINDLGSTISYGGGKLFSYNISVTTTDASDDLTLTFGSVSGGGGIAMFDGYTVTTVPVPEPSTTALLGLGGLALILRRRK